MSIRRKLSARMNRLSVAHAAAFGKYVTRNWHESKYSGTHVFTFSPIYLFTCVRVYLYNYLSMSDLFIPKRPVVAAYPKMSGTFAQAEAMSNYFKEKGLETAFGSLYEENLRKRVR